MTSYTDPWTPMRPPSAQRIRDPSESFYRDLMGYPVALRRRWTGAEQAGETPPSSSATPIEVPAGFRMGVWVDVGGRSLVSHGARHAALLHELGFSDACIMINDVSSTSFAFDGVSEAAIRSFAALLAGSGIRLTLTSWLQPNKTYIDDLVRLLPPLAIEVGAQAIELDAESNWRSQTVRGFANRAEATDYFHQALRRAVGRMEVSVTCEVDAMPGAATAPLLSGADIVVPQAYSTHGSTAAHRVGGVYGPRGLQSRALQLHATAVAASGRPLLMGLAAYGRDPWPGVSSDAIMRMELEQTLALRTSGNIRGTRYWSWKHIAGFDAAGGSPAYSYAANFFRRSVRSAGPAAAWTAPIQAPVPARTPAVARPAEWMEWTERETPNTTPTTTAPVATPAAPPSPQTRVLQSVRVDLPVTRQRIHAAKVYDPQRNDTSLRAVDRAGAPVDLAARIQAETRACLARYRQVHPVLARAIERLGASDRVPILAWIFHEHELARKAEGTAAPIQLASREGEATNLGSPSRAAPVEPSASAYTETLRASIRPVLDAARARFQGVGVEVSADLDIVPVLVAQATKAQIEALSRLPEVTGLYLHESEGIEDLANSIADAKAAAAHAGGFKGANVHVGIWERTPNNTTDLVIEETFDTSATAELTEHAQLVTAIIKNKQATGPKGFAPDCKTYSANKMSVAALVWAIQAKQCTVLNQSFHRPSEQTDPGLSADDLISDYLVVHPPFTAIVQAAGNGPATEYVNHKGFNTTRVGNHADGAASMSSTSAFRDPSSTHGDRELPDLSANGTTVTAVGVTKWGTSFASPAVAGTVAVLQSVDNTLKAWPEGSRAILLASAGRNVTGGTWSQAAQSDTEDGIDGSGALDTEESVQIARVRGRRNGTAARRGWDVGRLESSDVDSRGVSTFRYVVQVPATGARRVKAALAWSSKITYTTDATLTPPVKITESKLTVDLDLWIYQGSTLVAHSSTFDSSFEIAEFDAQPGATYELRIKRFSGTDWAWFGIAWTVF